MKILELAYKKHNDWNNIVKSFGCNPSMSEDVVMEMYIQLDADVKKGLDLYYNDEINHYYCYKVLRGIYTNLYKASLRQKKVYLEDINELKEIQESGIDEVEWAKHWTQHYLLGSSFRYSANQVIGHWPDSP